MANKAPTPATSTAAATDAEKIAPLLTAISDGVPIPNINTRRGANSKYPFDKLEIGQSFGISNKTMKNLASVVSGANKRCRVDAVDANGAPVFKTQKIKDANGVETVVPTLEREKMPGKIFVVADVDPKTDPQGASVRVWRKA